MGFPPAPLATAPERVTPLRMHRILAPDHADADLVTAPVAGDVFTFDGTKWVPATSADVLTSVIRVNAFLWDDLFTLRSSSQQFAGGIDLSSWGGAGAGFTNNGNKAGHPGTYIASTGTTSTGQANFIGGISSPDKDVVLFGIGDRIISTVILSIPSASSAEDRYTLRCGGWADAIPAVVDGIYFDYSDNVNGGRYRGVAVANGVVTTTDLGVGPSFGAAVWETLSIDVAGDASSATFIRNGTVLGSLNAGLPSGGTRGTAILPASIVKSVGTNARTVVLDFYQYEYRLGTPRP